MKKIIYNKAFTLLELIIATILLAIVLLGMFSINSVLSNNNQDYGQRYLARSATQTTLNHILNNASLAVGSGTKDGSGNYDLGILVGNGNLASGGQDPGVPLVVGGVRQAVDDPNSFCIHQDISPAQSLDSTTVNNPPTTPPSYTNGALTSRWLCYTWFPSTDPTEPYQIYYCSYTFDDTVSPSRGAGSCPQSSTYLGTAYSIAPAFSDGINNTQLQFSVTILSCLNNSATGQQVCSSTGTSGDPVNNPEVSLTGSVIPSQEGAVQN